MLLNICRVRVVAAIIFKFYRKFYCSCDSPLLSGSCLICVCVGVSEAGDEGSSSSSSSAAQRCSSDETSCTIDVKCTSLVARDNDSTAAAALTSAHVTANEHDYMVSSTIHSDGQLPGVSVYGHL